MVCDIQQYWFHTLTWEILYNTEERYKYIFESMYSDSIYLTDEVGTNYLIKY